MTDFEHPDPDPRPEIPDKISAQDDYDYYAGLLAAWEERQQRRMSQTVQAEPDTATDDLNAPESDPDEKEETAMSTNGKYPTWQQTIRQAQQAEEQKKAEREAQRLAHEAAQKKKRDAEMAHKLKYVLSLLGIEAEPTSATVQLDQYRITIQHYEVQAIKQSSGDKPGILFTLRIQRDGLVDDSDSPWCSWEIMHAGYYRLLNGDWTNDRAWLARILDTLEERHQNYEEATRRWREQEALEEARALQANGGNGSTAGGANGSGNGSGNGSTGGLPAAIPASLEAQLINLMREFIRQTYYAAQEAEFPF